MVAVVVAGFVLSRVFERTGLSIMIAISIAGVCAGSLLPMSLEPTFGPGLLQIVLPALIFEAAWDADVAALRRAATAVAVLAVPGVLVTCAVVATASNLVGGLALSSAAVLGAIVAATDPVSVLATFRSFGLPHLLVTIVEGESVANDGVALVLVQGLVPFALPGLEHLGVAAAVVQALCVSGGGIVAGVLVALPLGLAMRAPLPVAARVVITVLAAYASYAAASALGLSGIFASAAGGIALRALAQISPGSAAARITDRFWDGVALAINAGVFALVGMSLRIDRFVHEPLLLASALAGVLAARLILAYVLVPLRGLTEHPRAWRNAIALAGLRGGLSLALAVGLPAGFPSGAAVRDAVFAVVFVTLVVQGMLIGPLLVRFTLLETVGR